MFKSDILFTGYYGKQNTGDDAFVEVASWGANKYWNKKNNRFLAKKSKLPKVITPTKGYLFEMKGTYRYQASLLLNNTENFIYAGGSTIHSEMLDSNIRMKAIRKKEANHKLNFGAIGVSIGPFKSIKDERAVRYYLKQMDFLAVRDQASFDFVSSIDGLSYKPVNAFDLAALLPDIYEDTIGVSNNKKTIGISVSQYESFQKGMDVTHENKRNSMLVDLIKELDKQEDIHFKFYIINGDNRFGDRNLTSETIAKSNPKSFEVFQYNRETKKTWESIKQCDFIISTRLHAAIFACFAKVPFMLNEYHRKCGDFLDNIGYNDSYRLYNSEYDITKKACQIMDIINNKKEYVSPNKVHEMKKLSKLNFTAIKL